MYCLAGRAYSLYNRNINTIRKADVIQCLPDKLRAKERSIMGIFDKLMSDVKQGIGKVAADGLKGMANKKESFTFQAIPENLQELQALPEASLDSPFKTAALTVLALTVFAADREKGKEMLDWLKGPESLSAYEISFLNDRLSGKVYLPLSYFEGATPDNSYTPSQPFTIHVSSNPYSFDDPNYATLYIPCGGADSPRSVKLRKKGDGRWFLWEQLLLVDIRKPKAADPWA